MHDNLIERLAIETRYNQLCEDNRMIIEWRYKMFSRWLAWFTALAIAGGWIWTQELAYLLILPCFIGVFSSFAAWKAERRTVQIIKNYESEGVELERISNSPGKFSRQDSCKGIATEYDVLMPHIYVASMVVWSILLCAAIPFGFR